MGRKKTVIDWDFVNDKLEKHWDGVTISDALGISFSTLERHVIEKYKMGFGEFKHSKRAKMRDILKEKQIELALDGDKTMLVWLGKQYLDQSDKRESKVEQDTTVSGFTVKFEDFANNPDND